MSDTEITEKTPIRKDQRAYLVMLLLMREANKWHEYIVARGWSKHSVKSRLNVLVNHYKEVERLTSQQKDLVDMDWMDDLSEVFSQVVEKILEVPTQYDVCKALALLQAQMDGKIRMEGEEFTELTDETLQSLQTLQIAKYEVLKCPHGEVFAACDLNHLDVEWIKEKASYLVNNCTSEKVPEVIWGKCGCMMPKVEKINS